MKTIKDELREWMRPVSALTAFAKNVRNEQGGVTDDPSKAAKVEYLDPLADMDLDELPADQQAKLKKLQTDHRAQYDKNVELEGRRQKAEEFARGQQSRADKLAGIVHRHNLPVDGVAPTNQPNSADTKIAQFEAMFVKDGLAPEQAKAYAKMFASASAVERDSIMRELGPLVGSVGSIQAQQVLNMAKGEFKQVFSVPALAKQIDDNVALLVQQGNVVDEKTVNHLISMAWGQYSLVDPEGAKKATDVNQQQQVPQLRNGLPTGGQHVSRANLPVDGSPVMTQPETATIMSNIGKFMNADLPSVNKAKK